MKRGTLRSIAARSLRAATFALLAGATVQLAGCADENDPKTWVKRLDEPAQRSAAAKRLSQFFDDAMTKANKNREDPIVTGLLNDVVEPMTKVYVAGNLDDKTRKELMKSLADMRDPRTAPALAKAFNDFEPGKNDDDVKFAAQAAGGLAKQGKLTDTTVVDALWGCFAKLQPTKVKSINLVKDVHDAVLVVKHPSYGPKAVDKLAPPIDPDNADSVTDQAEFWQKTSIQVLKELKFEPAARALVKVVLTPTKGMLRGAANSALMNIPKASEPLFVGAINGSDAELAKMLKEIPDKAGMAVAADAVSWISRPAGRDALLAALPNADNDTNRTVIAQSLTRYPADQKIQDALLATYKKLPPGTRLKAPGDPFGRPVLVQVGASLYDAGLTDWVVHEVSSSKGDEAGSMQVFGIEAAIKLMTKGQVPAVTALVSKVWAPKEQEENFKSAGAIATQCGQDAACYVKVLDDPIPTTPRTQATKAVKACWMAAMYGKDDTKQALLGKIDKVRDPGVRLALVEAIDHLAPKGDTAAAAAIEKIVDADEASGNAGGDDALVKVAQRLRARAMP